MQKPSLRGYAVASSFTAVLLAGCGGSQPPIGAPGAMPQSRAIAQHAANIKSWMLPEAGAEDLIYVTSADQVLVYDYSGDQVGVLKVLNTKGLCSDSNGDVFVPASGDVYEYAHGGTEPIATLRLPQNDYYGYGCAVDPTTGSLAVTSTKSTSQSAGNVAIYQNAQGSPTVYSDSDIYEFLYCGYDDSGNLFANGMSGTKTYLSELPSGGNRLATISLDVHVQKVGAVQWDGQYLSVGDSYNHVVYQVEVSGTEGSVVGTSTFNGWKKGRGLAQTWISHGKILIPYIHHLHGNPFSLGIWKYPAGGKVRSTFALKYGGGTGVTVSVAPSR